MATREQDATGIEELLYQWGDECRSTAEKLGLPATSGIARMIEQQKVFEQRQRGVRRKRPPHTPTKLRDGTAARLCVCGRVYVEGECIIGEQSVCPRCQHDPRASEAESHGTETRSFKPQSMMALNATTAKIDVIVAAAPGWMQKCLRLSYLFRVRDSKAAQQLRIRTTTYREQREASAEYVAEQLAQRRGPAL